MSAVPGEFEASEGEGPGQPLEDGAQGAAMSAGPERNSLTSEETSPAAASTGGSPGSGEGAGHDLSTHERLAVGRSLLVLMQALSERYWGGGWAERFEYELWEMGASGTPLPEDAEIDAAAGAASAEPADLCVLADLCGGWWTWEDGPVFVPVREWHRRVAAVRAGEDPRAGASTDAGAVTVPGGAAAQE